MVAAVLGEAAFSRLCRYGIRLLGAKYDVDAYEEEGAAQAAMEMEE